MTTNGSIDLPGGPSGPSGPTGPTGPVGPLRFSPAFIFSRQGVSGVDTWLLANGIPSNEVGQNIGYANAEINSVDVDSSAVGTFDITFYEHDHVVFTQLLVVHVVADYGSHTAAAVPVTTGKSVAARVTSGSGDNISVAVVIAQQ